MLDRTAIGVVALVCFVLLVMSGGSWIGARPDTSLAIVMLTFGLTAVAWTFLEARADWRYFIKGKRPMLGPDRPDAPSFSFGTGAAGQNPDLQMGPYARCWIAYPVLVLLGLGAVGWAGYTLATGQTETVSEPA